MAKQFASYSDRFQRTYEAPDKPRPARENLDLLEKRRQDVVSSAVDVRRAFCIFGAFSLYLLITVGSTTHLQLLTGTVFKLPILSVDIPILGFYIVLPLLYVLAHANLMGELNALSEDVRRLKQHLKKHCLPLLEKIPFGPARTLIQPDDSSVPRALINLATSLTIAVLPPLILLLVQIRFLPYHSEWATWWHRAMIAFDIVLVLVLWYPLKFACLERLRRADVNSRSFRKRWLDRSKNTWSYCRQWFELGLCFLVMLFVLTMSIVWVTVPDGWWEEREIEAVEWLNANWPDDGLLGIDWLDFEWLRGEVKEIGVRKADGKVADRTYHGITPAKRRMLSGTYALFEAPASLHWMRRNLIVSHQDLVGMRPSDEVLLHLEGDELEGEMREKKVWEQGARGLDLRGRNLRYAVFSHSDMHKVDLRGADLEGAVFSKSKLRFADLGDIPRAELGGCADEPPLFLSSFWSEAIASELMETKPIADEKIRYCRTNLSYAVLRNAKMQHARLWETDLTKSDMRWTELQQANLGHADLLYVNLEGAELQNADLLGSRALRVNFKDTKLYEAKVTYPVQCSALASGAVFEEDLQKNQYRKLWIESICKRRFSSAPARDRFF